MAETQNNVKMLHRKEWQTMTPAPVATTAGAFMITDHNSHCNHAMFVSSATVHYLYHHDEDSWVQIPSGALAGVFGAGACGLYLPWSITYTANGGSTTTVQVAAATHNLNGYVRGETIELLSAGIATGYRATITDIMHDAGSTNTTLTLDTTLPTAILNNHTFRITSGSYFVLNAYATLAANVWKRFDVGTLAWQAGLQTTGLPAAWASDGKLVTAYRLETPYATGTADIVSATSIGVTTKNWTADQWINFQVRITAGTGIGQVRTITDSTTTTLTVATWTTTPDATSVFEIRGNEDFIYLLGNAAVTMYKYTISTNTWSAVAPTTARSAATGVGFGANHIGKTGITGWDNEDNIKDGRYIYSFRGVATTTLERFNISGGTNGAGAWQVVTYVGTETFTTGTSYDADGRYIYIAKEGTAAIPQRFFKYAIRGNYIEPVSADFYFGGAALLGNKIWVQHLSSVGTIKWLYCLQSTSTNLRRIMLF